MEDCGYQHRKDSGVPQVLLQRHDVTDEQQQDLEACDSSHEDAVGVVGGPAAA